MMKSDKCMTLMARMDSTAQAIPGHKIRFRTLEGSDSIAFQTYLAVFLEITREHTLEEDVTIIFK